MAIGPRRLGGLPALVVAACGDDSGGTPAGEGRATTAAPVATSTGPEAVREGSDVPRDGVATRAQAEQAALAAAGAGRVTWSGPEDHRGAAWEAEVTRPDGTEVDVLAPADGSVVREVRPGPGSAPVGPGRAHVPART